jgi:hypothetical protein
VEKAALNEGQGERSIAKSPADQTGIPATAPLPDRYVVYMFDDLHLGFGDLSRAREAAQRQLQKSSDPATRIAVFSTSGLTALDFTNDRTKVDQVL